MSNKIYKICENIAEITQEEIDEIVNVYEGQINYTHPFKRATQHNQNELGKHNKLVLEKLLELKSIIDSAE